MRRSRIIASEAVDKGGGNAADFSKSNLLSAADENDASDDDQPKRYNRSHHRKASLGISIRRWLLRWKAYCCGHGRTVSRLTFLAVLLVLMTSIIAVTTTVVKRSKRSGPEFQRQLEETRQRIWQDHSIYNTRRNKRLYQKEFDIIFPQSDLRKNLFETPKLEPYAENGQWIPDYGDLNIRFFDEEGVARVIYNDPEELMNDFRDPEAPNDDDVDLYFAFDDDYIRGTYVGWSDTHDEDMTGNEHCRRNSEHRFMFPTCNNFHETSLVNQNVHYLNSGAYRQVMSLDHPMAEGIEKYVIKEMNIEFDYGMNHFEYVRMDAIVAERLAMSPRIYDIYGYCGLSLFSEFFPHGDVEGEAIEGDGFPEDDAFGETLESMNKITLLDKLGIGCDMAEAIADLHGYKGGVIIHGDIQLAQFLYTADYSLVKMNDFNRAEWMLWDDNKTDYCRYTNGGGGGTWRAPEEYHDHPLNEKVDVWSLGNNLYALLTGLWPFYDKDPEDTEDTVQMIMAGRTAFLDDRYRNSTDAERVLVETIEKCWKYNPSDRPSIFEVAQTLRDAWERLRLQQEKEGIVAEEDHDDDNDDE